MRIQGAEVEVQSFQEGRANLIARFSGGSPGLMLAEHMDVVPAGGVEDWTSPPYEARVRAGKLYGRGAADMKAAVAAMVAAVGFGFPTRRILGRKDRRPLPELASRDRHGLPFTSRLQGAAVAQAEV